MGEGLEGDLKVPYVKRDGMLAQWVGEGEFTNVLNPKIFHLLFSGPGPPESINPKTKRDKTFDL